MARMDANGWRGFDEPLDLQLGVGSEVNQDTQVELARIEIVEDLRTMRVGQGFNGFDLNNDLIEAKEVRSEILIDPRPFVDQCQSWLCDEGNTPARKFDLQTRLIDRFRKSTSHLIVDLEARTRDGKGLILEENIFIIRVHLRYSRASCSEHSDLPSFAFICVIRGQALIEVQIFHHHAAA